MKAIVYTSSTGFTAAYAKMLGDKTALPVYALNEAKQKLKGGDDIIYMGWMFAGSVKDYKKAAGRYNIKLLLAVGMAPAEQGSVDELRSKTGVSAGTPIFYLQGGYAPEREKGLNKLLMSAMAKSMIKKFESKAERTPEDEIAIKMFKEGCDFVSEENLRPVLEYLNKQPLKD